MLQARPIGSRGHLGKHGTGPGGRRAVLAGAHPSPAAMAGVIDFPWQQREELFWSTAQVRRRTMLTVQNS